MSYKLRKIIRDPSEDVTLKTEEYIRMKVGLGDIVQLSFFNEDDLGDNMWVVVTQVAENFKGILANEPVEIKSLKLGDEIEFGLENIRDIKVDYPEDIKPNYKTINLKFVEDLKSLKN